MYNRREFVKTSGLMMAASSTPLILKDQLDPFHRNRDFLKLFKEMDFTDKDGYLEVETRYGDTVRVMPYTIRGKNIEDIKDKLNIDALHTIIRAATDRNIIVFDSQAEQNEFSTKLVDIMNQVMRQNGGGHTCRLTDMLIRENKNIDNEIFGIKIHHIEDNIWNHAEQYYLEELNAYIQDTDKNLVIGLCNNNEKDFVYPIYKQLTGRRACYQKSGLCVVDNSRLLLGTF